MPQSRFSLKRTLLRLLIAYCWFMGLVGILVCMVNGTPGLLIASAIYLAAGMVGLIPAFQLRFRLWALLGVTTLVALMLGLVSYVSN